MLKLDPINTDYVPIGRRPRTRRNLALFPQGGRGGKGHPGASVVALQQGAPYYGAPSPAGCPDWCDMKLIGHQWQCYCG